MSELEIKTVLILLGFKVAPSPRKGNIKWRVDRADHEFILYLPKTGTYAYTNFTMSGYKESKTENIQELLEIL